MYQHTVIIIFKTLKYNLLVMCPCRWFWVTFGTTLYWTKRFWVCTRRHLNRPLLIVFCQVMEWHKKLEVAQLLEMRLNREVVIQKKEIKYLKNVIEEKERSISALEDDLIQESKVRPLTH